MRQQGLEAETLAAQWLAKQGCQILERNVSCRGGELDIVVRHGKVIALVEVKHRRHSVTSALQSVGAAKQRKLSIAAAWLYAQHEEWQSLNWRFDVLAVVGDLSAPRYEWMQAAFDCQW